MTTSPAVRRARWRGQGRRRCSARSISARRPGPSGSGITMHPTPSTEDASASGGSRRASSSSSLLRARQSGSAAREAPTSRRGGSTQLRRFGGRVSQEHGYQLPPPAAAFALEPRAGLRVPLHRVGRELLDVGEDRLGQQAQQLGIEPGAAGRRGHPPPRHARARHGRRTAAHRASGPGAAPRRRGPRTPPARARGRPKDCAPARGTGAAPRSLRYAPRGQTCPRRGGRSRAPRARSWPVSRR